MKTPSDNGSERLARLAFRALKRSAKLACVIARRYGTPIHVESNGKILALKA